MDQTDRLQRLERAIRKKQSKQHVDCIQCGYCCGYRNNGYFGGCSYANDEEVPSDIITIEKEDGRYIPVDEEDVCIYLEKLDNGFARCTIQDKKPKMCKLYYCLTEKKIKYLQTIIDELKEKVE